MYYMPYKQVIIVRVDINLPKGKLSAQVSHASVSAVLKSHKDDIKKWKDEGMKKVVLKVKDLNELINYKKKAEDSGLVIALIEDAGLTVVTPGTITCLGIGPNDEDKIDMVTGNLKCL